VDFTIVTPSFRQLDWLACCIASIADQDGVTIEHIVQDAGTDGFAEFAEKMKKIWPDRQGYRRVMASESDQGMYDAVNKGLKKGAGTFCAYLNCDEQYLPGALARVKKEFEKKPATEILYGGFLVVDEKGGLVTAQRPVQMCWQHVATCHLPNFTCANFFRRTMLERDQAWFETSLRACGDAVWTVNRLKAKTETRNLPLWTSLFMENQNSMGLGEVGRREAQQLRSLQSAPTGLFRAFWMLRHRAKKIIAGDYIPRKISTRVFTRENPVLRQALVGRPSPFWSRRIWARV
jgi:glycosyltransferase involved in cell wall biosynthesis